MAYLFSICSAWRKVLESGTVGPDAIVSRSSPITSERMRLTRVAGWAARARPPPLTRERCLRTVLISCMVAPHASRSCVTDCLSSRVTPSAGATRSADPPPEIRQMTRSRLPAPLTNDRISSAPRIPLSSGTGWLPS